MPRQAVSKKTLGKIGMEVGVVGFEEIVKNIGKSIDRMTGEKAKRIWMHAALAIVREVRDNIHSITGQLSRGIFATYGLKNKPNVLAGVSIGGRGKAPHGWVVEHGHGGPHPAPPHPYFRPGVISARPIAAVIITTGMKELARSDL